MTGLLRNSIGVGMLTTCGIAWGSSPDIPVKSIRIEMLFAGNSFPSSKQNNGINNKICALWSTLLAENKGPNGYGIASQFSCEKGISPANNTLTWTLRVSDTSSSISLRLCRPSSEETKEELCDSEVSFPRSEESAQLLQERAFSAPLATALLDGLPVQSRFQGRVSNGTLKGRPVIFELTLNRESGLLRARVRKDTTQISPQDTAQENLWVGRIPRGANQAAFLKGAYDAREQLLKKWRDEKAAAATTAAQRNTTFAPGETAGSQPVPTRHVFRIFADQPWFFDGYIEGGLWRGPVGTPLPEKASTWGGGINVSVGDRFKNLGLSLQSLSSSFEVQTYVLAEAQTNTPPRLETLKGLYTAKSVDLSWIYRFDADFYGFFAEPALGILIEKSEAIGGPTDLRQALAFDRVAGLYPGLAAGFWLHMWLPKLIVSGEYRMSADSRAQSSRWGGRGDLEFSLPKPSGLKDIGLRFFGSFYGVTMTYTGSTRTLGSSLDLQMSIPIIGSGVIAQW